MLTTTGNKLLLCKLTVLQLLMTFKVDHSGVQDANMGVIFAADTADKRFAQSAQWTDSAVCFLFAK